MSEMTERVARAICGYPFDLYDRIKDDPNEAKDQGLLLEQMEGWRVTARAAIEAMREPTIPMLHAAYSLMDGEPNCECMNPGLYVEWKTMIDEALK